MNLITDVMNVALTQGHTSNTAFKGSNNFFQHESEECFLLWRTYSKNILEKYLAAHSYTSIGCYHSNAR